ncbi:MAG: DUF4239 domain-containing protein [Magnetospirillum sp. WYHS-4]
MMVKLLNLDLLPLTLLFILGGMAVHTLGTLAFDLYTTQRQLADNNDLIQTKMPMFQKIVLLAILFGVSISWLHYGTVNARIQQEATRLGLLARAAEAMPEPARPRTLLAIAAYAETIADADWRQMREGGRSQAAADALSRLAATVTATEVATPRQELHLRLANRLVRELAAAREARIESALFPLAQGLQIFLYLTLGATLLFIWFAGLPSLFTKLVMGWFFVALVMVILMYIHVLSNPLGGYAGMDSEPYAEVARAAARAAGPPR